MPSVLSMETVGADWRQWTCILDEWTTSQETKTETKNTRVSRQVSTTMFLHLPEISTVAPLHLKRYGLAFVLDLDLDQAVHLRLVLDPPAIIPFVELELRGTWTSRGPKLAELFL